MNQDARTTRVTVVLDSNVLISGSAFPRGNPFQILQALDQGRIQAYISPFILEEVRRNLRKFPTFSEPNIEAAIAYFCERCIVIDPPPTSSLNELSPEDNRVLDCAIQGQVQYLVTGDRVFLSLRDHQGVRIITPRDFLATLETM